MCVCASINTHIRNCIVIQSKVLSQVTFPHNNLLYWLSTEGWASFQGSCYLLSTTTTVWQQAEDQCRSSGGHLLVLNNAEELHPQIKASIVDIKYSYWIGLVERQHEGHWSWVDGTDFGSTPTFWDQGQPDNWDFRVNGEDCGQLHASVNRKRKLWNDADCSLGYRYICEAKA
uniref:Asialoglycoprotein receptor-like 1 n=1 Tax=Poecilia reticulata TaxID=8081 RepID=A0A3P9Q7V7_POERE